MARDNALAPMHSHNDRYIPFITVMDRGASDHVAHSRIAPEIEVKSSAGSRRGQVYSAAGGKTIPDEGEQSFALVTNEGTGANLTYQVADVRRPLTSVAKVCDRRNRVIFGRGVVQCRT